jgi:alkanesulfonate monooxygenase SsuD/methylene tetrahydromethanopterin reductase-like flavin-dependent oxidoreductase (luciferase family)
MRFGTYFFLQAPPGHRHPDIIRRELDQMVRSEELGFDEVWLTEHHFIDYGLSVDPATLASAVASRTSRVRIGLAAAILPFHDPIRLAEQMALVDIISNGRLDVGVGRGNRPSEFSGYRVPQIESRERFDEAVQILQLAWTEERFRYDGRFYRIPEVRVIPKPVQRPHPPLYQVCVSPDSIEGTALRGWPMLNSLLYGGPEQLATSRDRYVATLQKVGAPRRDRAPSAAGVSRQIYVAPTDAQALAEAKDAEMWYQESFRRFVIPERIEDSHPTLQPGFRAMAERLSKITWEGLVAETLAFGSPDTVARHIEQMRQMGVGQVMCWMNRRPARGSGARSMELFAREVMPASGEGPLGLRVAPRPARTPPCPARTGRYDPQTAPACRRSADLVDRSRQRIVSSARSRETRNRDAS